MTQGAWTVVGVPEAHSAESVTASLHVRLAVVTAAQAPSIFATVGCVPISTHSALTAFLLLHASSASCYFHPCIDQVLVQDRKAVAN